MLHSRGPAPDHVTTCCQDRSRVVPSKALSYESSVLANAPAALETYVTVSALNGKSELGLAEREVMQLIAATQHGCDFCVAGHTAVALNKARTVLKSTYC